MRPIRGHAACRMASTVAVLRRWSSLRRSAGTYWWWRGRGRRKLRSIVSPTEPGGRSGALEAPHGPIAAFDAPVILLQPVVQIATGPMPHSLAQLGADRPRIAVVTVGRDPVRCHAGHRLRGTKE